MNKKIIKLLPVIIMIVALVAIITFSTITMFNSTMAWFAHNKNTDGNGMTISIDDITLQVEVYDGDMTNPRDINNINNITYNLDVPGSSVIMVYKITNTTQGKVIKINSLLYAAPTATEEVAKVVDSTSYYLSTQLYIKSAYLGKSTPTAQAVTNAFAVGENPTDAELYGTVLYDGTGTGPGEYAVYQAGETNILLDYNEFCFIAVKVTFKNDPDHSQNVYIDFGKGDNPTYFCKRKISLDYTF